MKNNDITQREISTHIQVSLGKVNNIVNMLEEKGYIDSDRQITTKAESLKNESKVKNAIILAAGYGFRLIPINHQINKAFIEVKGEILIERLIEQLHAQHIYNITIVVGYMKEQFDYLIDKYNIKLKVNRDYATSNTLYSLAHVKGLLNNTYIIPCDLYFEENPFSSYELFSWHMISDRLKESSFLSCKCGKLKYVKNNGNEFIGLSFIHATDKQMFMDRIDAFMKKENSNMHWEEILMEKQKCLIDYRLIHHDKVVEINTYLDLQEYDPKSKTLKNEIIETIQQVLQVEQTAIKNITALKTGMTNRTFLFECNHEKYIMRIPGEGTSMLINRYQEKDVYSEINGLDLCDDVIYFDDKKGLKLTKFISGAHNCDPMNKEEVKKCMLLLRKFHSLKLSVHHTFDIFEKIEYYESLWNNKNSIYRDYAETKENVFSLKKFIDEQDKEFILTHIDAVPDNFIFFDQNNEEQIRLIDWEYASMQDPHVDVAMFSIYAMYDKKQIDRLIDYYFENKCDHKVRIKIYCYIACCGLLWSNWCEYKHSLGVEFGEYSLAQYRFAKDFYKIAKQEMEKGS